MHYQKDVIIIRINCQLEKIKRKLEVRYSRYFWLYKSYWNARLFKDKRIDDNKSTIYVSSGINHGAGMAHQLICWRNGYYIAKKYGLNFVHNPLWINGGHTEDDDYIIKYNVLGVVYAQPSGVWDRILGLNENELKLNDLKNSGSKVVKIPLLNLKNKEEEILFKQMIKSYEGRKTIFQLAIDQEMDENNGRYADFYKERYLVGDREGYGDTIYNKDDFNIAVHIRRGDVDDKTYPERYLSDEFYINAIKQLIKIYSEKRVQVYIFSEGKDEDFKNLVWDDNIHLCVNMNSKRTFIHMVESDAIIVGISGFSIIAALIGDMDRYAPKDYASHYPTDRKWYYLDKNGCIV